jgi:flagellar export protein FliJ
VKKFSFTLERVRQWREKQLAVEEARLQQLFSEKSLVEQRRALLEKEGQESAALVTRAASIQATELQAISAFRRYVIAQRSAIAAQLAECDRRIAEQQGKLLEARRKSELLARLKEKKWKMWNAELAREIETQAGEIFLAKWNGERR